MVLKGDVLRFDGVGGLGPLDMLPPLEERVRLGRDISIGSGLLLRADGSVVTDALTVDLVVSLSFAVGNDVTELDTIGRVPATGILDVVAVGIFDIFTR